MTRRRSVSNFECTKRSRLRGTHRWCQNSHPYPLSHAGNHKQGAMHGSPGARANPKSGPPPFGHQHYTALHQLVHTVSTIMHGLPLRSSISWSFRAITVGCGCARAGVLVLSPRRARAAGNGGWLARGRRGARAAISPTDIYCCKKTPDAIAPRLSCAFACCPLNGNWIDKRETRFTGWEPVVSVLWLIW